MPALNAIFGADATPFKKELQSAERIAQSSGKKIEQSLSGAGANWRTIGREIMVIFREIGRGNWARIPGSFTIIIQALNLSLKSILGFLPALGRITIVGTLAYNLADGIKRIANAASAAANSVENLTNRFEAHNRVMREASQRAAEFREWIHKLGESHITIASDTEDRIKALREEFEFQQKLAKQKGQTPAQAARAEIEQTRKEVEMLRAAKDASETKAQSALGKTRRLESSFPNNRAEDAEVADKDAKHQAEILAALLAGQGHQINGSKLRSAYESNTLPQLFSSVNSPGDRLVNFEFQGQKMSMTLNEATKNFQAAEKWASASAATVKSAEAQIRDAREAAQKAESDRMEVTKKLTEKADDYALKAKYLPTIAAGEGGHRGSLNALQRVGAYSPGLDIQIPRQIERHLYRLITLQEVEAQNEAARSLQWQQRLTEYFERVTRH